MAPSFRLGSDNHGSALFRAMHQFFEEDEWHPQRVEDQEVLQMGFNGKNGRWRCIAAAYDEQDQVVFYAVLDTQVPLEKRRLAAEYITRANYGLRLGNFEMDFEDGEVRCRAGIDVEDGKLVPTMIRNLAHCCCALMDRYLPGLMKVAFGEARPSDAIQEIEQPQS